jgi:hypothetical protein
MSEQTETLIKLLNQTSSGRGKSNIKVKSFQYRRTATDMNYKMRVNTVQAATSIATAGQTIRVQLPTFGQAVVGDIFLKVNFKATTQGTYKPYVGAQCLKSIKLRHSDVAYELLNVKQVWAYLLSKCKNKEDKDERKKIFGNSAAAAGAQELVVPLLTPWSPHFNAEMYGTGPIKHARRHILFPAYALRENCVFELEFESCANLCSADVLGAEIQNVDLCWEEVVASPDVLARIKKELPKAVCAPDFTAIPVTCDGNEQKEDVTSILSRAPTHSLCFYLQETANADDPFNCVDVLQLEEIIADGRTILTNRDEASEAERRYKDILRGRPRNRGAPQLPSVSFDNDGGYSLNHAAMQISNTAANSVTLNFKPAAACAGQILAVHERHFSVDNGTIKNTNVY